MTAPTHINMIDVLLARIELQRLDILALTEMASLGDLSSFTGSMNPTMAISLRGLAGGLGNSADRAIPSRSASMM